MCAALVPRQLALIRGAIAELAKCGLTIDSFTIDPEKLAEFDNLSITARNLVVHDDPLGIHELGRLPRRTLAGIPLNVKRP